MFDYISRLLDNFVEIFINVCDAGGPLQARAEPCFEMTVGDPASKVEPSERVTKMLYRGVLILLFTFNFAEIKKLAITLFDLFSSGKHARKISEALRCTSGKQGYKNS